MKDIITNSRKGKIFRDYKTHLQEVLQSKGEVNIWYKLIDEKVQTIIRNLLCKLV